MRAIRETGAVLLFVRFNLQQSITGDLRALTSIRSLNQKGA
jgi:hypothetical protein